MEGVLLKFCKGRRTRAVLSSFLTVPSPSPSACEYVYHFLFREKVKTFIESWKQVSTAGENSVLWFALYKIWEWPPVGGYGGGTGCAFSLLSSQDATVARIG